MSRSTQDFRTGAKYAEAARKSDSMPVCIGPEARLPARRLAILRIINRVTETSAPYNQFSLPLAHKHRITLCTYYKSKIHPSGINAYEGNGTWSGFFSALDSALAARKPDLVHIHSPFVALLFLAARAKHRGFLSPTLVTLHNSFRNFKLRNRLFMLPSLFFCQKTVCCSRSSFSSLPEMYRWIAGERLTIIQNGVNLDRIDEVIGHEEHTHAKEAFTIASVGRLETIKNPHTVLRAFRRSAGEASCLRFIGDGELRQRLEKDAGTSGVNGQIFFSGIIPRENVYSTLATSHLFVSASRGEGLPIAALEAMACRCPVILSDIPPHREITDGLDCVPLIQTDDVNAWSEVIVRYQRMSPGERAAIGTKCRRHVEEHFSVSAMHREYEKLYQNLLKEGSFRLVEHPINNEAA